MVRLSFAFDAIFFYIMRKEFNSNGVFWSLLISIEKDEILFYKNAEDEPFYYITVIDYQVYNKLWESHLSEKNWFTNEMLTFINSQITQP